MAVTDPRTDLGGDPEGGPEGAANGASDTADLFGRRTWLGVGSRLSLALGGAVLLWGGLRSLWPRPDGAARWVRVGVPNRLEPGQVDDQWLEAHGFFLRRLPTGLIALSARCPHLGCRLRQDPAGVFRCTCHGSQFSTLGSVLRGPAARDMERLALLADPEGQVFVDPTRVLRRERGDFERPSALLPWPTRGRQP